MNILSFDIEEWYIEKHFKKDEESKYLAYDSILSRILDLLDSHSLKATFFCLGGLVDSFPQVVKKIADRGHEIGCHSNRHQWVNKMTPKEFYKDTYEAVAALQDCTGQPIKSYRAPAFSIGESNKWAFEVLYECGIENDASIFPGKREVGGFPSFDCGNKPCKIVYNECAINEFPITMGRIPVIGKKIAFSGGGYFRLLPLVFIKSQINTSDYVMGYFHMLDLLDFKSKFMTKEEYERYFKETGTLNNRLMRYLKSNIGRKRTFTNLTKLINSYEFMSIKDAVKIIKNPPIISL